jgi:Fe-S cluster assembly iron-binding protein IscA
MAATQESYTKGRVASMLRVTNTVVALLKAAKSAEGAPEDAGIRIRRGTGPRECGTIGVGFAISDGPEAGDAALEQDGLRIFVERELVQPLENRTLDVRNDEEKRLELVFR